MSNLHLSQDHTASAEDAFFRDPSRRLATETTWFERLCMNLLSYSVILLPIALVVFATKFRLFPNAIISSPIIQWFVYGSSPADDLRARKEASDNSLLSNEDRKNLLSEISRGETRNSNDGRKRVLHFIWCLVGLQTSYLIWGLLQEKIMTTHYPASYASRRDIEIPQHQANLTQPDLTNPATFTFHDSQFLVFINRIVAFTVAIVVLVYSRKRETRQYSERKQSYQQMQTELEFRSHKSSAPLYEYIYCSLSNILSSWCQYEALKFVNYPTQCLSKSCKVVPVMLMSKIMNRKRYPLTDYMCAILLALGMFIFMFNQASNKHPSSNDTDSKSTTSHVHKIIVQNNLISGLLILALYLLFDSFTSNWQQSLNQRYSISEWQMMAAVNFYSILLTLTSLHQLGNLQPAFKLLASSSILLRDCIIMSLMSSLGQMFVYHTIKNFGSVVFSIIMTLRQFFSVILSCAIYGHKLNFESTLGLVLIFMVAFYQVWQKLSVGRNSINKRQLRSSHAGNNVALSTQLLVQDSASSSIGIKGTNMNEIGNRTESRATNEVCIQFKALSE